MPLVPDLCKRKNEVKNAFQKFGGECGGGHNVPPLSATSLTGWDRVAIPPPPHAQPPGRRGRTGAEGGEPFGEEGPQLVLRERQKVRDGRVGGQAPPAGGPGRWSGLRALGAHTSWLGVIGEANTVSGRTHAAARGSASEGGEGEGGKRRVELSQSRESRGPRGQRAAPGGSVSGQEGSWDLG